MQSEPGTDFDAPFVLRNSRFIAPQAIAQIEARQPRIVTALLLFIAPSWGPTFLCKALLLLPAFNQLIVDHPVFYRVGFFASQITLVSLAIRCISIRYANAVWRPSVSIWKFRASPVVPFLCALALLAWHACQSVGDVNQLTDAIAKLPRKLIPEVFAQATETIWDPLIYGASPEGIVMTSVMILYAPVLEEMIFSGLIMNRFAAKVRPVFAIGGTGLCFALAHVPQYQLSGHILELFCAGVTYASVRLGSGTLWNSIVCHLTINAIILTPKWIVAGIGFHFNS